jgi:ferritin
MSLNKEYWRIWNFMQWFVKEQTEEESLAMTLLDKLKIAGGEKVSSIALYSLDRDLEKISDGATSAQDVTAEKP